MLRVFSNFSLGYLKLKKNESLWKTVNDVSKKKDLNNDVKEELNIILETFKPIEKPEILSVTGKPFLNFLINYLKNFNWIFLK